MHRWALPTTTSASSLSLSHSSPYPEDLPTSSTLRLHSKSPTKTTHICIHRLTQTTMAPTTTTTGVTANSNGTSSTDIWSKLPLLPEDAIFELNNRANAATGVVLNLAIGAYRDEDGLPHPLQAIRKAERILLEKHMNYEYLPIAGFSPFVDAAVNLLYGDSIPSSRVLGVQSVSGTGAVMLGARLLTQIYDPKSTPVYLSNPTWPNHYNVLQAAGWTNVRTYRYYKPDTRGLDFEGYKADVLAAPDRSIFLIHACAHNPTGVDPTHAQWEELADLFQRKQHQVFFDCAYQGYASGSLERDAFAIRLFARKGIQFICAQSFSKNMGLYSERTGTLSVVLRDPSTSRAVKSQIEIFIREVYSSPPAHGARLAHLVLTDPSLRKEWEAELEGMAQRIHAMRKIVFDELTRLGTPGRWDHITNQIGMFSFLGLTKEQCVFCQNHNVFITLTGRANMAGLTEETAVVLAHVIDASLKA